MNIVKVRVKTGIHKKWTGYFNGVPTVNKLRRVISDELGRWGRDILSMLPAAEPVKVTQDFVRWVTLVRSGGVQIGTIEYEEVKVYPLKNPFIGESEQVQNILQKDQNNE